MKSQLMRLLLIISFIIMINSALYSLSPSYTVSYQKQKDELAHCYFQSKQNSQGWNYLRVYANANVDLLEQHRATGFLEGYLTYNTITYAFRNWQKAILKGNTLKPSLVNFLNTQIDYVDQMAESHKKDIFWEYAQAKMQQLRFMYRGFLTRIHLQNRLDLYINWIDFYCLTNVGDLQDLLPAFQQTPFTHSSTPNLQSQPGNCNLIVKLLPQTSSLLIGHSTHNHYSFMLRVMKTFNFPSRNSLVGSDRLTFSSRPGDMVSKDDFYTLSSGLIIMQTSMQNMKQANWKDLKPTTVPTWLRQTIACHLARDAKEWTGYFLKERSGTHNSQWVLVEEKNIRDKKNVVTFVQDAFSIFDVTDMTDKLYQDGYVASYNMPYSQKIYQKLGYQKAPYDYNTQPRAGIYQKLSASLTSQQSLKVNLLLNNQSLVTQGLAPRYDLSTDVLKKRPFGLTDCKVISSSSIKQNYLWAINGPSLSGGRFLPFQWKNWDTQGHQGMMDRFQFGWVKVDIQQNEELNVQLVEGVTHQIKQLSTQQNIHQSDNHQQSKQMLKDI